MNTVGVKLKTYAIKVLNMLFALRLLTVGLHTQPVKRTTYKHHLKFIHHTQQLGFLMLPYVCVCKGLTNTIKL